MHNDHTTAHSNLNSSMDPNATTSFEPVAVDASATVFTAPAPAADSKRRLPRSLAIAGAAGLFAVGGAIGLVMTSGTSANTNAAAAVTETDPEPANDDLANEGTATSNDASTAGAAGGAATATEPDIATPVPSDNPPAAEDGDQSAPAEPSDPVGQDDTGDPSESDDQGSVNPYLGLGFPLSPQVAAGLIDPSQVLEMADLIGSVGITYMPDVIGMNRLQAAGLLSDLGLEVTIQEVLLPTGIEGSVRSASIEEGTIIVDGQQVTLVVVKTINPFD